MSHDITVALIMSAGTLLASLLSLVGVYVTQVRQREQKEAIAEQSRKLDDVHEQTVNTHTTNFRHDLDRTIASTGRIEETLNLLVATVNDQRDDIKEVRTAQELHQQENRTWIVALQGAVPGTPDWPGAKR